MKKQDFYKVIQLTAGSPEYSTVESKFTSSMSAGGFTFNGVNKVWNKSCLYLLQPRNIILFLQISRIQNMKIYHNYMTHKLFMDEVNPPNTQNERELWHGTSPDALDEIHATGFNRSFCGKNGSLIVACILT